VWRARALDEPGGEVALKVLPDTELGRDPRRRAQLRHEAERGARLDSPHLLPTYEFGEADGAAYMAMPLVVGCSLADVIERRREATGDAPDRDRSEVHDLALAPEPVYVRDVVTILTRVARAAHQAHLGLVVHRDIKPGNVLLYRDHARGVFLCDFGLARDLDVATPAQLRDGAGSPLYMAPERLLKRPADEVRCDVFALGVTLFEALTLVPPVPVPEGMPRDLWPRFLASAAHRRPSRLMPTMPAPLEAAILRATARDPAARHATAAELARELEAFLRGSDVGPVRPPAWPHPASLRPSSAVSCRTTL
jgi:serine/threonine-protein kinase